MRTDFCRPNNKYKDNLCLSENDLKDIAEAFNLPISEGSINREGLWTRIQESMTPETAPCKDNGACLLHDERLRKHGELKSRITNYFRTEQPKKWQSNMNTWLTTDEILEYMKQMEEDYPQFKFFGPSPIDFDAPYRKQDPTGECVTQEICSLDLKTMNRKEKKYLGFIFNLDKHTQSGSHWVALFVDLILGYAGYFDSFGRNPPKEIQTLLERLKQQHGNTLRIVINKTPFQKQNSQCGMYSIHFITMLLQGSNIDELLNQPGNQWTDAMMMTQRNAYFRPTISREYSSSSSTTRKSKRSKFRSGKSRRGGGRRKYRSKRSYLFTKKRKHVRK
jgi:hypothetical protein